MSASWASPGSVIETSNQMDDDSKILRQKKFEQQRAIQQQRQQQKRQVPEFQWIQEKLFFVPFRQMKHDFFWVQH